MLGPTARDREKLAHPTTHTHTTHINIRIRIHTYTYAYIHSHTFTHSTRQHTTGLDSKCPCNKSQNAG